MTASAHLRRAVLSLAAALVMLRVPALARSIPDPVPVRTPDSNAAYSNAHPVPQGGALGGRTIGPAYAPDPFHIDWDRFCVAQPRHCTAGNPHYVATDRAMVRNTLPYNDYSAGVVQACSSGEMLREARGANIACYDAVGIYYASASDPLVRVVDCGEYGCGSGPDGVSGSLLGAQIHIPYAAVPQFGGDGHLSVKQPSGIICQLYFGKKGRDMNARFSGRAPITTSTISVDSGACAPPDYTREGVTNDGATPYMKHGGYASEDEMSRGLLRPEDIVGSAGDGTDRYDPNAFLHALYGSFANNQADQPGRPAWVWPAINSDGPCTASQTMAGVPGALPYEGMYLYLDRAGFAEVAAWQPPVYLRWLKRAIGSLHRHGMIDMDSSGCAGPGSNGPYVNALAWSSASYAAGGGTSPLDAYLARYVQPYESRFEPGTIRVEVTGGAYTFDVLGYRSVPGLSSANFHWLDLGCGQFAVLGSSEHRC